MISQRSPIVVARAGLVSPASDVRPELRVDPSNLSESARELAAIFAASPLIFETGTDIVKVRMSDDEYSAELLNPYNVINETHLLCRPIGVDPATGSVVGEITLP